MCLIVVLGLTSRHEPNYRYAVTSRPGSSGLTSRRFPPRRNPPHRRPPPRRSLRRDPPPSYYAVALPIPVITNPLLGGMILYAPVGRP
jgi:hypothetical protein